MLLGKEFGPYVVDKELGSGAMGTVFRGRHKKSGELVAIKLMSVALGTNELAINRFMREVTILKQLDHPNIVHYKGSGKYHKAPFYVMEYVEGESLDHILARRGHLAWDEVVEVGLFLCAALQHAHDQGIIHRDLKPSNLMILTGGVVKLTDFGIAKDVDVTALTAANSTVGTIAYMSPEQCRGSKDITHKSDLYSMGIMFYELLTGKKPFSGQNTMEVFLQHANKTDYKRPIELKRDVPIWLDTLVIQLMEKEPGKRPQNAAAVAEALKLIKTKIEVQKGGAKARGDKTRADGKTSALPLPAKQKLQPFYARTWFTLSALALIPCLAVTGIYFAFLRTPSAEALYEQAETLLKTDAKRAREEPITAFLLVYPTHEKSAKVQRWADDYDFELLDRQMHNRRNKKFKMEGRDREEEALARQALDAEDEGKLTDAAVRWHELSKRKGQVDAELHAWGLVGERYGQQLREVAELIVELKKRKADKDVDDLEGSALAALQAEQLREKATDEPERARHLADARSKWEDLQRAASRQTGQRRWVLLAAGRLHELK